MNPSHYSVTATLLAAGISIPQAVFCTRPNAERKPNVIIILADDIGYEGFGPYGGPYSTPHIDSLARRGVRFDYAFSQPLSTPTRVQLMTGRYNYKNYVEFGFLDQRAHTFGHLAREAGYATCIVGKWQLGRNPRLPEHFGFDHYCLWQLSYPKSNDAERYGDPLIEQDGIELARDPEAYGPDIQAAYIDRFIEEHATEPFFIYYPMTLVHNPFVSTPDSHDWTADPRSRHLSDPRHFPDMVAYCDKLVGQLVRKLREQGLYNDTVILFMGDNGTNRQITTTMRNGHVVHGGKGMTTDAGTHAGLIAAYGDRHHGVCRDLVDFTDILPTVADAMGTKVPKAWDTDGVSFYPQLLGHKGGRTRRWVFCHYDPFMRGYLNPQPEARRFIRNHRYKLYSTGEFYDVERDELEQHDILSGTGSPEAEKARRFLSRELAGFPAWKPGDPGNEKIVLPGLELQTGRRRTGIDKSKNTH